MTIETIHFERPYKFSIVQAKGSSTHIDEKPSYSGTFDLVVQDGKGAETSRKSLNQYFGKMDLTINGPVSLTVQDYNGDNLLDFPIGFSAADGSSEYKYVIFSVSKDGKIFSLPVTGYKEDGFVYSAEAQARFPLLKDGETGFVVTLSNMPASGFTQGKYGWNGTQFVFTDSD